MIELALLLMLALPAAGIAYAYRPRPEPPEQCSPPCESGDSCCAATCLELPTCP